MEQRRNTPESNALPLIHAAISYAQNSWPVFPLAGKIPYKDSQEYKDATLDEQQIQVWWTTHQTANIGLATGEQSGVIVLDIDPPEGYFSLKELQSRYTPLPDTKRSRTANKGVNAIMKKLHCGHNQPRLETSPW